MEHHRERHSEAMDSGLAAVRETAVRDELPTVAPAVQIWVMAMFYGFGIGLFVGWMIWA